MSEEKKKRIVFRDSYAQPIFSIPDGGEIRVVDGYDGDIRIKKCRYIDEMHLYVEYTPFHINEYYEIMQRNGHKMSRPDSKANKESLQGYTVEERIIMPKGEFMLGRNEAAEQKFAVWQSSLNELSCYRMLYCDSRHEALEQLLNLALMVAKSYSLRFHFKINEMFTDEEKEVVQKYEKYLLPDHCFIADEVSGEVLLIRRGIRKPHIVKKKQKGNPAYVKKMNKEIGVTDAQVTAMKYGLIFGFQDIMAFPYRHIVDYEQLEIEYCERTGVTDVTRKENMITYYANYPEYLSEPRHTYKVQVNLDTMKETRTKLKKYLKKGNVNKLL